MYRRGMCVCPQPGMNMYVGRGWQVSGELAKDDGLQRKRERGGGEGERANNMTALFYIHILWPNCRK